MEGPRTRRSRPPGEGREERHDRLGRGYEPSARTGDQRLAERGAPVEHRPSGPGADEQPRATQDGEVVSNRAGCHREASGEVAGTGRSVQRRQQPGSGSADQSGQRVRLGGGRLFAPQGGGAAGGTDQGPWPGVFQVGGDIPDENRRDQQ